MRNRNQRHVGTPSTVNTPGPLRLEILRITRKRGPTEKEARAEKEQRQIDRARNAVASAQRTLELLDREFPSVSGVYVQ